MDEIINISVNGYSLTKDSNVAGTQGDCNSTKLRITFAENWSEYRSEYAKSITFWNALGENPVKLQLGTDLLEDILKSYDVYLVPIPGEAMTEAGENSFVIEGSIDGKAKRSVEGKLKVLYSPSADNAGNPASVTPDLANQIRAEIDGIKADVAKAEEGARYAEAAQSSAEEASKSASHANTYASRADTCAREALKARDSIEDMTATAELLGVGVEPTVEASLVGDVLNMHFGIPAGESGVYMGDTEPTDPNVKVWIDTSGDADGALSAKEFVVGETKLYMDEYGAFFIDTPQTMNEHGVPNFGGSLSIDNGELLFNGTPVGSGGSNGKDLINDSLTEEEKANFMRNTGLDARLGGIEANISTLGSMLGEMDAAIDEILATQEAYIASNEPPQSTTEGGDGE